eukprot:jgi/Chrzof1/7696/Cz02g33090.t1
MVELTVDSLAADSQQGKLVAEGYYDLWGRNGQSQPFTHALSLSLGLSNGMPTHHGSMDQPTQLLPSSERTSIDTRLPLWASSSPTRALDPVHSFLAPQFSAWQQTSDVGQQSHMIGQSLSLADTPLGTSPVGLPYQHQLHLMNSSLLPFVTPHHHDPMAYQMPRPELLAVAARDPPPGFEQKQPNHMRQPPPGFGSSPSGMAWSTANEHQPLAIKWSPPPGFVPPAETTAAAALSAKAARLDPVHTPPSTATASIVQTTRTPQQHTSDAIAVQPASNSVPAETVASSSAPSLDVGPNISNTDSTPVIVIYAQPSDAKPVPQPLTFNIKTALAWLRDKVPGIYQHMDEDLIAYLHYLKDHRGPETVACLIFLTLGNYDNTGNIAWAAVRKPAAVLQRSIHTDQELLSSRKEVVTMLCQLIALRPDVAEQLDRGCLNALYQKLDPQAAVNAIHAMLHIEEGWTEHCKKPQGWLYTQIMSA